MFKKFARGMSALAMSAMLLGAEPVQACCLWDGCCELVQAEANNVRTSASLCGLPATGELRSTNKFPI